jgi:hypothetical protein
VSDTIITPLNSVQLTAPPDHLIGDVMASINAAVEQLPPDKNNAFVAVADLAGMNAAFVHRTDDGWAVKVWVGKTWKGPAEAGAQVMKTW